MRTTFKIQIKKFISFLLIVIFIISSLSFTGNSIEFNYSESDDTIFKADQNDPSYDSSIEYNESSLLYEKNTCSTIYYPYEFMDMENLPYKDGGYTVDELQTYFYEKSLEFPEVILPDVNIDDVHELTQYEIINNVVPDFESQSELTRNEIELEREEFYVQAAALATPSITATNITKNSVTINVVYPDNTAWGNLLNCYDWANAARTYYPGWTTTAQYNVQNGTYTKSGLEPGRKYTFTMGYYQNSTWYYKEIHVFTLYNTPSVTVSNITSTSATFSTAFPNPTSPNNYLYFYDTGTWYNYDWVNDVPRVPDAAPNTRDGTYNVTNLVPNNTYKVKLSYYNDQVGAWQETVKTFTTSAYTGGTTTVSGNKVSYTVPGYLSSKISATLRNNIDVAFDDMKSLTGNIDSPWGITFNMTTQRGLGSASGGGVIVAISGNPIKYEEGFFNEHLLYLTNYSNTVLRTLLHEMGHNFDNSKWSFDSEFFAELLSAYVLETRKHTFSQGKPTYYNGDVKKFYKTHPVYGYDSNIPNNVYHHYGLVYTLLNIKDTYNIGWEPFKKTFEFIRSISNSYVPSTINGKFNLFLTKLRDFSGVDIISKFTTPERVAYKNKFGNIEYVTIADDYGNDIDSANNTIIDSRKGINTTKNGLIDYVGDIDYFKFTVPYNGSYTINLSANTNIYASLYEANNVNYIARGDAGLNYSGSIRHELEVNKTYYLKINHFNNSATGTYSFIIQKPKVALVVLPGIMGSRLFYGGSKKWDPNISEATLPIGNTTFMTNMKPYLICNEDGTPKYTLTAADDDGAQDAYLRMRAELYSSYNSYFDFKFFAYDWRLSSKVNATKLQQYLDNYDSVVIVAHSMGGIVASSYLSLSTTNKNKVKTLITIGTPYMGSVKAIKAFESGEMMGWVENLAMASHIKELSKNMPSVYELLPTSRYPNSFTSFNGTDHSYSQSINYFSSRTWAKTQDGNGAVKGMLNDASMFHNGLMVNNEHIANTIDKVYYIYGTNIHTPHKANYKEILGINSIDYYEYLYGDGTVIDTSAKNGKNSIYTHSLVEHVALMSDNDVIREVRELINKNLFPIGMGPLSILLPEVQINKKINENLGETISVIVQGAEKTIIKEKNGNNIIKIGEGLYIKDIEGNNIRVGSAWLLNGDTNRIQYVLNSNDYNIYISEVDDNLSPELLIIKFDNEKYVSKEYYNDIEDIENLNISVSSSIDSIKVKSGDNNITPSYKYNKEEIDNYNNVK